uniref:Uncharacterized protein n=1 Tax=Rhizophora mucronata TaxID=61149 RepID=A0A2P2KD77_RHIMU
MCTFIGFSGALEEQRFFCLIKICKTRSTSCRSATWMIHTSIICASNF